jgi:hypothetical protein
VLGSDAENPALLSPCEWADVFFDQSRQVRQGEPKNGVWHVEFAREGEYELTLRRWPAEAQTAISAGVSAFKAADGMYSAGVALPIVKARLKVADVDESLSVGASDTAVTFRARLKAGPAELKTWFYGSDGRELCGAYYVEVRRR